jgi:hypothetical protein
MTLRMSVETRAWFPNTKKCNLPRALQDLPPLLGSWGADGRVCDRFRGMMRVLIARSLGRRR